MSFTRLYTRTHARTQFPDIKCTESWNLRSSTALYVEIQNQTARASIKRRMNKMTFFCLVHSLSMHLKKRCLQATNEWRKLKCIVIFILLLFFYTDKPFSYIHWYKRQTCTNKSHTTYVILVFPHDILPLCGNTMVPNKWLQLYNEIPTQAQIQMYGWKKEIRWRMSFIL